MRIGIDASCWQNSAWLRPLHARAGWTARRGLRLRPTSSCWSPITFTAGGRRVSGARAGRRGQDATAADPRRVGRRLARSPLDLLRLGWQAARCGADVFWFPTVYSFYPVLGRVPVVIAFHDAMTEQRPDLFFPTRRAHAFWRAKVWLARRQASTIVTPSESARQQVAAALRWPVETIARIDEAPAAVFCKTENPERDSRRAGPVRPACERPAGALRRAHQPPQESRQPAAGHVARCARTIPPAGTSR